MVKEDTISGGDKMQQKHPFIWSSHKGLLLWKLKLLHNYQQGLTKVHKYKKPPGLNKREVVYFTSYFPIRLQSITCTIPYILTWLLCCINSATVAAVKHGATGASHTVNLIVPSPPWTELSKKNYYDYYDYDYVVAT